MDEDQSVDGSGVEGEEKGTAEEGGDSVGVAEEGEDGSVPTTGLEDGDKGVAGEGEGQVDTENDFIYEAFCPTVPHFTTACKTSIESIKLISTSGGLQLYRADYLYMIQYDCVPYYCKAIYVRTRSSHSSTPKASFSGKLSLSCLLEKNCRISQQHL